MTFTDTHGTRGATRRSYEASNPREAVETLVRRLAPRALHQKDIRRISTSFYHHAVDDPDLNMAALLYAAEVICADIISQQRRDKLTPEKVKAAKAAGARRVAAMLRLGSLTIVGKAVRDHTPRDHAKAIRWHGKLKRVTPKGKRTGDVIASDADLQAALR